MLAFGFTLALLAFWTFVGYAALSLLRPGLHRVQEVLLAPTLGLVLTVLPLFVVNRAGVPVGRFAAGLTLALLLAAAAVYWRVRPRFPLRRTAAFAAVALLALVLSGWPMFQFGLDWLSFCNDDMANYTLSAERFIDYGWFHPPTKEQLLAGTDYSLYYWFLYVSAMVRGGCELVIAWAARTSGLTTHEVFMPLILAFHGCLITSTGALVYRHDRDRGAALTACLLLAASAVSTFGMLYQLIAQVSGLSILAACATTLFRPFGNPNGAAAAADAGSSPDTTAPADGGTPARDGATMAPPPAAADAPSRGWTLRQGVLVGILGSGLMIVYPEVLGVLGIAWLVHVGVGLARRTVAARPLAVVVGCAAVLGLVLLNRYVITSLAFMFNQATSGTSGADVEAQFYPFYLLPSGVAAMWGFIELFRPTSEPVLSVMILGGGVVLALAAAATAWGAWRQVPAAAVATVMLLLGVVLFARGAGFGLYKLAMFVQPFALATLATGLFAAARSRGLRAAMLLLFVAPGLVVQWRYVQFSRGVDRVFGEVPDASTSRVTDEIRRVLAENPSPQVISDCYNVVLSSRPPTPAAGGGVPEQPHREHPAVRRDLPARARGPPPRLARAVANAHRQQPAGLLRPAPPARRAGAEACNLFDDRRAVAGRGRGTRPAAAAAAAASRSC